MLILYLGTEDMGLEESLSATLIARMGPGHVLRGQLFARNIEIHQNAQVLHEPLLRCDETSPCSETCPCDPGAPCDGSFGCGAGLECLAGVGAYYGLPPEVTVCSHPGCGIDPRGLGCGEEGKLCGPLCTLNPPCEEDADCPWGVCGVGNGPLFGDPPGTNRCWNRICTTDPVAGGCGTTRDPCGECHCVPSCAGKACGDDPTDGCGGQCPLICQAGEAGCTLDVHCPSGYACLADADAAGTLRCRPRSCLSRPLLPPACGDGDAPCGPCPACPDACAGRQCGADPECGTDCGTCPQGSFCTGSGQCLTPTQDSPIMIPDGQGGTRMLEDLDPGPTRESGSVAGWFEVSDRGMATYTIPIEVPPGRAGLQPELTLVYTGGRTDGPLGMGWQITGTSMIERCQRIYALDGQTAAVSDTAADKFCLDGKRLMAVSGSYGADGTQYRTMIDTLSRIVSYGGTDETGPESFKVWTKGGRILEYRKVSRGSSQATHVWLLDTVSDRSGNTMKYDYERFIGQRLVGSIVYSGHGDAPGSREVRFEYGDTETTPDNGGLLRFNQAGDMYLASRRLTAIRTVVGGQVVHTYAITHETAPNGVRRIREVTECEGTTSVCKPDTRFEYYDDVSVESGSSDYLPPGSLLDLNGDGIYDVIARRGQITKGQVFQGSEYVDMGIAGGALFVPPYISVPVSFAWEVTKVILRNQESGGFYTNSYLLDGTRGPGNVTNVINIGGLACPNDPGAVVVDLDHDGQDDVVEKRRGLAVGSS